MALQKHRESYTAFHRKLLFWSLIIQRVQNAEIGISHHSMDNQAPKKETFDEKRYIGEYPQAQPCAVR
jgi:hypothetical protein